MLVRSILILALLGCLCTLVLFAGVEQSQRAFELYYTSRYSQFSEEGIIRDFFKEKKGGVFLDVGSGNAIDRSTTYYLERELGWKGVAVDGNPMFIEQYAKKRPGTLFFNYAVSDHSGGMADFTINLAGLEVSSLATPVGGSKTQVVHVPFITLDDLLDKAHVSRIDLLSMDIEGFEPSALEGFSIERFKPELVCIEAHSENRAFFVKYFTAHKYHRLDFYSARDFGLNWYFAPDTSTNVAREN